MYESTYVSRATKKRAAILMRKAIMNNIGLVQLPNDQKRIPALVAYGRQIADMLGFSQSGAHAIQVAFEEA